MPIYRAQPTGEKPTSGASFMDVFVIALGNSTNDVVLAATQASREAVWNGSSWRMASVAPTAGYRRSPPLQR